MEATRDSRTSRDRRHNARFSRVALQALKEWLRTHSNSPYPTEDDKAVLGRLTGLNVEQINTWFANARRRSRVSKDATTPKRTFTATRVKATSANSVIASDASAFSPHSCDGTFNTTFARKQGKRLYQCTFCTDTFNSKYDWTRHETSLHISLRRYLCCPFAPVLEDSITKATSCAYCGRPEPSVEHIESHNHTECQQRDPEVRTFYRKDHLRQHLRSVHECDTLPHMDTWVLEAVYVNSRCGFCGQRFTTWAERNDHIAAHFKNGTQMESWKGCRGLDASISAEVRAAMPPFLIGLERLVPHPFSASSKKPLTFTTTSGQYSESGPDIVSSWEILAIKLQQFTKQSSYKGCSISDEALQKHARLIMHGSSEVHSPTAADSSEWLDLFKKGHSLGMIPDALGGEAEAVPDDLEAYQDLGLRMPSTVLKQRHAGLMALFLNMSPLPKDYPRFSSLPVAPHRAIRFETIAGPWPDSGVLGQLIITRDWIFSLAIQAQRRLSTLHSSKEYLECTEQIKDDFADLET